MKNKKTKIIVFFGIALILVLAFLSFKYINFAITTQYFERPEIGYLRCDKDDFATTTQMMSNSLGMLSLQGYNNVIPSVYAKKDYGQVYMDDYREATPYSCKDFIGLSEGCSLTVKVINGNLDGLNTNAYLDYQIVSSGDSFSENNYKRLCSSDTSIAQNCKSTSGIGGYDNGEKVTLILGYSDKLYVRYLEAKAGFFSPTKYNNKVQFIVSGFPYTIKDYNTRSFTNGQKIAGAIPGDCLLRDDYYKNKGISSFTSLFNDQISSQELDWRNLNAPTKTYDYLAGTSPASWSPQNGIQQYNGQTAYCDKGTHKIYAIQKITSNGQTYNSVILDSKAIIGDVNCCEREQQPGKICQDNQWIQTSTGVVSCDLDAGIVCPDFNWAAYGDKQIQRISCNPETNKCDLFEVKDVECLENQDCNGGCCIYADDWSNNKCGECGSGDICGDNECSTQEQRTNSCNQDCGTTTSDDTIFWFIVGIVILAIFIIGLILYALKKKKPVF